jgi:hypothetical protein
MVSDRRFHRRRYVVLARLQAVPWTLQIVNVVFVSRASTHSLYFECGYLDLTLQGSF